MQTIENLLLLIQTVPSIPLPSVSEKIRESWYSFFANMQTPQLFEEKLDHMLV